MDVSKGIIPVGVIEKVEADPSDSKVFHITTKGRRKYIFNAETTEDKLFWMRTLNVGIMVNEVSLYQCFIQAVQLPIAQCLRAICAVEPYSRETGYPCCNHSNNFINTQIFA